MTVCEAKAHLSLEESWAYKVTVLADMVARRIAPIVQSVSGLNLSQWRVLAAVADHPGCTASQVVEVTPMDKGIVSRAVSYLIERNLVERRASPSDGRVSHLFLTPEGDAVYAALVAAIDREQASGRGLLPPAVEAEALQLLHGLISAYGEAGTRREGEAGWERGDPSGLGSQDLHKAR